MKYYFFTFFKFKILLTVICHISDLQNSQTLKSHLYVFFCYHKFFVCIKLRLYICAICFFQDKKMLSLIHVSVKFCSIASKKVQLL